MSLKVLKYFVYFCVLFLFILFLNRVFIPKHSVPFSKFWSLNDFIHLSSGVEIADGFYQLPKNSLDVVFCGSSHCHTNINPNILWNEYGIASYDFAASGQDLKTTYYYMQEIFKYQKPKLLVVECGIWANNGYGKNTQMHWSLDQMRFGIPKLKCILTNVAPKNRFEMLFPIIKYHYRWKEIEVNDFKYFLESKNNIMGGGQSLMIINEKNCSIDLKNVKSEVEIPVDTKKVIYDMISLSKKHDSKILFIKTPLSERGELDNSYASLELFCKNNDISFINFNRYYDKIGTDFAHDYHDLVHMSYWGNVRFSKYLGKIIKENFIIPDRRNEDDYGMFAYNYKQMLNVKNEFDLEYKKFFGQWPNLDEHK